MASEFSIPLSREELLQSTTSDGRRASDGRRGYTVTLCSTNELTNRIDECQTMFAESGLQAVYECFDIFYSVIHNFDTVSDVVREHYWHIIIEALVDACQITTTLDKSLQRSLIKMIVYLVCQFVEEFESLKTKNDSNTLQVATKKRKPKKGLPPINGGSGSMWESERERVLVTLLQFLDQDLVQFWDPPTPEMLDDLTGLVANCCCKMMESPEVCRDKDLRGGITSLLGIIVKKYHQNTSVSLKMVQLLRNHEHLVSGLSQIIKCMVSEYEVHSFVANIIEEICDIEQDDLNMDTGGTKNYSSFLIELSVAVPNDIVPCVECLMNHLGGESYTMRNGVLSVFGEIISSVLTRAHLSDENRTLRDSLFEKLSDHIHDVNAFVRSKVLQVWYSLSQSRAIPLFKQKDILTLVAGRLKDKSTLVRKSALQLLTNFITTNPFAPQLDVKTFKDNLLKEEETLRQMLPSDMRECSEEKEEENNETCKEEDEGEGEAEQGEGGEEREGEGEGEEGEEEKGKEGDGGGEKEREGEEGAEVAKQMAVVQYHRDAVTFIEKMTECFPLVTQLLGSKVVTDVLESLEFIAVAHQFNLSGSHDSIRKALVLIWSSEQAIRDLVMSVYVRIFIAPPTQSAVTQHNVTIVKNLLSLIDGVSIGEMASLEEMIVLLITKGHLPNQVIGILWDIVSGRVPHSSPTLALILLSMAARVDPNIVLSNIGLLLQYGLLESNLVLSKWTCVSLQRLHGHRFQPTHEMFTQLTELLIGTFNDESAYYWTPLVEQAVVTIYSIAEQPDYIVERIIKRICKNIIDVTLMEATPTSNIEAPPTSTPAPPTSIENSVQAPPTSNEEAPPTSTPAPITSNETTPISTSAPPTSTPAPPNSVNYSPVLLSRLFFVLGQVAKQQLIHVEVNINNEMRKRRNEQQNAGHHQSDEQKEEENEEEIGLSGATDEDMESELLRKVCNNEIVGVTNLLGTLLPLVVAIVTKPAIYPCPQLQTTAVLTLCKYMLVSSIVCDQYLRLLFTLLEGSSQSNIRANTIIALGDLTVRFPNLIQPWTSHLYSRLRDMSHDVRQNTIVVLTHLVLNDMIKVKGQISEMALCLEDTQHDIVDRAKLFFMELSRKGNALYNVLPDIISHLSDPSSDNTVSPDQFRSIMKYLLSFVQKDKHSEGLADKLCHRFRATRTEQQAKDLSYCLSQINFSERGLKKLQDNLPCYHGYLSDTEVYNSFLSIISKGKKLAKTEVKVQLDEFEIKLTELHQKGLEQTTCTTPTQPDPTTTASATSKSTVRKRPLTSTRRPQRGVLSPLVDNTNINAVSSARRQRGTQDKSSSRPTRRRATPVPLLSDSEED